MVSTLNSAIAFEMVWRRVSSSSIFFVGVGKQGRIGSGQCVQQLFNFCLHLCQLYLIGCQLRIDLFLFAVEYLKIFELLLHGRENELLKFFFANFPAAWTAFVFRPFGTAEISGAVWYMGGFQSIPTMTAFDFFRPAKYFSVSVPAGRWYLP